MLNVFSVSRSSQVDSDAGLASRPLNVLELESSKGWGGQELRTCRFAAALDVTRFHTDFAVQEASAFWQRRESVQEQWAGRPFRPTFFPVPMRRSWDIRGVLQLRALIKRRSIDIVSCHSGHDAWLGLAATRGLGIPVVRTRHLQLPISSALSYNWSDRVLCDSLAVKKTLEAGGVLSEKICVVPSGIDTEKYAYDADAQQKARHLIEQRLQKDFSDKPLIGMAAMLRADKGHSFFFEALARIQKRTEKNCQLILFGKGPQEAFLRAECRRLALANRVHFFGFEEDLSPFLAGLDLLVLPSKREAFGQALIEAQASGVCVLGSRVGGIPEALAEGRTGLLFESQDRVSLEEKLLQLLDDQALRKRLAVQGPAFVRRHFSLSVLAKRLESIYTQLQILRKKRG